MQLHGDQFYGGGGKLYFVKGTIVLLTYCQVYYCISNHIFCGGVVQVIFHTGNKSIFGSF